MTAYKFGEVPHLGIYKVTYPCDSLDPNPTIKTFDGGNAFDEMQEWVFEEVESRVQYFVEHSPYSISEKELFEQEEWEYSLVRIEQV